VHGNSTNRLAKRNSPALGAIDTRDGTRPRARKFAAKFHTRITEGESDEGSNQELERQTRPQSSFAAEGSSRGGRCRGGKRRDRRPTIWAQEIKDIELRHVGVSYSVVKAIGDQAAKDLGFKVTMQNLDTSAAINRFITQPNSVDIADLEGWQAKLAAKRGVIQGIQAKKIKEFDNFLPIFTKGELSV
jgi:putative spermidine/putrescine transport system substrate-binding protein